MSTSLNTNPQTSFSTIYNTFKEARGFFKNDGVSLRMSGDNLHTKSSKPSRWGTQAKMERGQKREAATKFVTNALDRQLKKLGFGDGEGSRLISKLREGKIISSDRITIKDLKTITNYAERTYKTELRDRATKFDSLESKQSLTHAVNKSHHEMETFKQAGLDGLVEGATWNVSDHGVGGAILVTGQNGTKSVLKFDGDNIAVAEKSYQLLNALRLGSREPLPFVVPNLAVIDLEPQSLLRNEVDLKIQHEITSLKQQIETARVEQKSELEISKLETKLLRYEGNNVSNGFQTKLEHAPKVVKLEMIENATQANLLDVQTKHALLNSTQFGQNIGKSMVILDFLGFNDHLNSGNGVTGATNFSNLMINSEGHIHLIDPSMHQSNDKKSVGSTTSSLVSKMREMVEMLKGCKTKGEAIQLIEKQYQTGVVLEGMGTPLGNLMSAVFGQPDNAGRFFYTERRGGDDKRDEQSYLNSLSEDTKMHFMANATLGMLEGIRYLDRNRNDISSKIDDVKVEDNKVANYDSGQVLNEIHNAIQEIGKDELNKIEMVLRGIISERQDSL